MTPRVVAILQARMGSTRLPGKVLADLGGRPMIAWAVRAARAMAEVHDVVVATSNLPQDAPIAAWCLAEGVACVRGDEQDVLARFHQAATLHRADVILRLTADCPLLDPAVCDQVIRLLLRTKATFAANVSPRCWPMGLDCEAFTMAALDEAQRHARLASEREHVTIYIRRLRERFPARHLSCPLPDLAGERWLVDTPEDLAMLRALVTDLPPDRPPNYLEVLRAIDRRPHLKALNRSITGKPADPPGEQIACYGREGSIQRGFLAPVITHADRGRAWDVDGNEYVDLLTPNLPLGHRHPAVDDAIRRQLEVASHPWAATLQEELLSKGLRRLFPWMRSVQFFRHSEAALKAASLAARARTGHERIVRWRDGSTEGGKLAGVIAQPWDSEGALAYARRHGGLLIHDLTDGGLLLGPPSEMPDLACVGDELGNGLAIAALLDCEKRTTPPEPNACDALAVAAAGAVVDVIVHNPAVETFAALGRQLADGLRAIIARTGAPLIITGPDARPQLSGAVPALFDRLRDGGVLCSGRHVIGLAHTPDDIAHTLAVYQRTFAEFDGRIVP